MDIYKAAFNQGYERGINDLSRELAKTDGFNDTNSISVIKMAGEYLIKEQEER